VNVQSAPPPAIAADAVPDPVAVGPLNVVATPA
jgi:hypothetical protein